MVKMLRNLMKEDQIQAVVSSSGSKEVKVLTLFVLLLPIIIIALVNWQWNLGIRMFDVFLVYSLVALVLLVIYRVICLSLCQKRQSIDLSEVEREGQTGDIILFKTHESYDIPEFIYYRLLLALCTRSDWSHVALLVRCPDTGKLYIWESSETPSFDHMTNGMHSGIKLADFHEKVHGYNGYLGYRRLRQPLSKEKEHELFKACMKFKGTPFRKRMFSSGEGELNCAESISLVLDKTNIYKTPTDLLKMLPCNFSSSCNAYSKELWDDDRMIRFH